MSISANDVHKRSFRRPINKADGRCAFSVRRVGSVALSRTTSPLQEAAKVFELPRVFWVVGIGAATAMLGVLLSQIDGISRMMFAMSRRGDLPGILEHTSDAHSVPDVGIIVSGSIIGCLSIFGTLESVLSAAAFTILLYYSIANIAALRMAAEDKLYPKMVGRRPHVMSAFGILSQLYGYNHRLGAADHRNRPSVRI